MAVHVISTAVRNLKPMYYQYIKISRGFYPYHGAGLEMTALLSSQAASYVALFIR